MAWSTRQLAELAGTTLKAVRHYHEIGLLDEPARTSNGYKQYEVPHLLRLLQIRRLADLGVPLSQIPAMSSADANQKDALQVIDAELAVTIERLQRIRLEIAALQQHGTPAAELPVEFGAIANNMTETDRSLIMIYSRVFTDGAMRAFREIFQAERSEVDEEFAQLPPDADLATKRRLAERLAPEVRELYAKYPWMHDPDLQAFQGNPALLQNTVNRAIVELYNLAQLEVIYRAHLLATGQTDERLDAREQS
ncbi:MerR family transcriptional regulator [Sphaerisporangium sp. NPDC051011]|uniref:MerR family transcriptional regulator n=1 Tax=Sphaerisporangium sp. NPDC051011 TaxID=3155792 RepID=UPI0033D0AC23